MTEKKASLGRHASLQGYFADYLIKQLHLFPKRVLEPIRGNDTLTFDNLVTRYRCRCGNTAQTGIKLEAIICTRCGAAMKLVA